MAKFEGNLEKNRQLLGKLQDYFVEYQSIPSYRYMQDLLGIRSKEAIGKFIGLLKEEGYLEQAPDKKLIPKDRFFEIPLSDTPVQAGAMTQILGEGGLFINIFRALVKKPSITEVITVKGDSMLGEFSDRDKVVVVRQRTAKNGDIVVATINDEQTVKFLGEENGRLVLIPANKNYETIRSEDFEIYGVVKGMYRTY